MSELFFNHDGQKMMRPSAVVSMQKYASDAQVTDPRLLEALALTENGAKGYELGFGVGKSKWYGVKAQLMGAANQIKLTEKRFEREMGRPPIDSEGQYVPEFLQYFSWGGKALGLKETQNYGYAPLGVDNDPNGLNANHYPNLERIYRSIAKRK
jgi:hypothetical protein